MHFTVYNCPMAQPHRCNHTQTPRPRPLPPEIARHWRAADGIDLFEADYKRFTFPKHSHDYYAFGTILNGAEQFMTGGTNYVARRGQLLMMNPMQVHDGGPACDDGYQYQIMFIAPKVFGNLVDELSPHSTAIVSCCTAPHVWPCAMPMHRPIPIVLAPRTNALKPPSTIWRIIWMKIYRLMNWPF